MINIIFSPISVRGGMAGNRRVENLFKKIRDYKDIRTKNIFFRNQDYQKMNALKYCWNKCVRYIDLYKRICRQKKEGKNIVYYYGAFGVPEAMLFCFLRYKEFYVIIDITEDSRLSSRKLTKLNTFYKLTNNCIANYIRHFVNGVIVISDHLYNYLCLLINDKDLILKIPVSVDFDKYKVRKVNKTRGTVTAFYGGAYGLKDGVEEVIKAFNLLSPNFKHIRLILAGQPERECKVKLLLLLKNLNNPKISYKGYLSSKQYHKLIHECDILIVPRRNIPYALGGYPFKLGEFMATGNAVLCSSIKEVREMFADTELCFYNPDDKKDLQKQMLSLIVSKDLRCRIGRNGKARAFHYFDSRNHAKILRSWLKSSKIGNS